MLFSRARARLHALRSTVGSFVDGFVADVGSRWIARHMAEIDREDPGPRESGPPRDEGSGRLVALEHVGVREELAFIRAEDVYRYEPEAMICDDGLIDGDGLVAAFFEHRRAQFIRMQVASRAFIPLAHAWKNAQWEARNLSMLPHDADGIHWPFAGPIMARELWMTQFILIAILGVEPQLAVALGKRILNEWHDLEPEAGLTDDEKKLLGLEREEQRA